jgi:hypothetical protein
MAGKILRRESTADAAPASPEVEFALVLSRMISSITEDPQQLRASLYELARHKLDEQISNEDPEEQSRILKSLEVAIHGVETHYSRMELRALGAPEAPSRLSLANYLAPRTGPAVGSVMNDTEDEGWQPVRLLKSRVADGLTWRREFSAPWRYATVLALATVVALAIHQSANLAALLKYDTGSAVVASQTVSKPPQASADHAMLARPDSPPAEPDSLIPTMFGVYAISDGKLYTLEVLPGHAPHPRVAISAAISMPSKTILPDRHIKFVVFRRDSATTALNRADVRVIAKISQATKFDPSGKPIIAKVDDTWVIRNISYPYRTAPYKGQSDMYEVVGDDPDKPLSPGRYALILKDEAYDFSVAGEITDSKQCLESLAAANGNFYAECQKK